VEIEMAVSKHVSLISLLLGAASLSGCGINSVPTAEEAAKAKWADVQAAYQRRADLIPNLEALAKGASGSEKERLTEVINARSRATSVQLSANDLTDPAKVKAFQDAQAQLSGPLSRLLVNVEQYPNLKSQDVFRDLVPELSGTENRITTAVQKYNASVQEYNTTIRTFPDAIGAKIFYGAKPMEPFKATTPGAERAPKLDFGK
jgi:LemA protein